MPVVFLCCSVRSLPLCALEALSWKMVLPHNRLLPIGDCCIKANRCVAFGIRLRSHTEVCSLQTSPSAPCASSFLQSQDNLASKIVRLLTFATVSYVPCCSWVLSIPQAALMSSPREVRMVVGMPASQSRSRSHSMRVISELGRSTCGMRW